MLYLLRVDLCAFLESDILQVSLTYYYWIKFMFRKAQLMSFNYLIFITFLFIHLYELLSSWCDKWKSTFSSFIIVKKYTCFQIKPTSSWVMSRYNHKVFLKTKQSFSTVNLSKKMGFTELDVTLFTSFWFFPFIEGITTWPFHSELIDQNKVVFLQELLQNLFLLVLDILGFSL